MNLEISQFPIGEKNPYGQYFNGQSYLYALSTEQIPIFNVTFEPACRNFWHIHHAKKGGGQILLVTAGRGYYQEYGKEPRELHPGDVVNIPAGVKHWHGAARQETVGLRILQSKCRQKTAAHSGVSQLIRKITNG